MLVNQQKKLIICCTNVVPVKKQKPRVVEYSGLVAVGLLGLEPRLFWTKTRRVASYTIDQCVIAGANLKLSFGSANIFLKKYSINPLCI